MNKEHILFIGGWHLYSGLNHRTRYMANFFKKRFVNMDIVGYKNFYDGPPAPLFARARQGLVNLAKERICISHEGTTSHISIRDIYAPHRVEMQIKDLWRYINLCRCISQPYDLAVIGYPGNAWTASLLKRSGRVNRIIYDDWDYHPGLETNESARRRVESRERLCARQADVVMTVNELLGQLRHKQGAKKVVVVPNGVNLTLLAQGRKKSAHPPTLIYMGALSTLWNVDLSIRSLPALSKVKPDIRLLIAGYGPAESELKKLCQTLGVCDKVNFLGRFEYEDLPSILSQADVGIATSLLDSSFRYYASPLKLLDYMAAGLPVIASRLGQTELTVKEANAGILINNSEKEFVEAASALLNDESLHARYSQAAIEYSSSFDWDIPLEKAYQTVLDALKGNPLIV